MLVFWSILCVVPCVLSVHLTKEPVPPVAVTRNTPQELWFAARLDHFHATNTDVFQMRYFYSNEFDASSYILIYVGGEWTISPGWLQAGFMYDLAQTLPAAMFYTEHRYYGQTRPTNDTSSENLRYLTVDQSLADLAQFITFIKSDLFEGGKFSNAKVGLIGCSYAGSMATWMRLAYPHLVDAALSDSGPLHAQADFPEYLEVITDALRTQGSEQCVDSVKEAMEGIQTLLATQGGPAQISLLFNTCTTLDNTNWLDLATFYWFGITETFAYLVQYATPGQIPAACEVLTDESQSNAIQRLANWITSQSWTQPCIESRYSQVLSQHQNVSYDAPDSVMRLWTYQTCVEFGWYQTTTSQNQPFLSTVPLQYFHQMCQDFFGDEFNEARLNTGIERTNLLFGGVTFIPDHVVTVQGAHDPWSPMGPNEDHSTPLAQVYVVPEISHCRTISSPSSTDSQALTNTRAAVRNHLTEKLTGVAAPSSGHWSAGVVTLVMAAVAFVNFM